MPHLDLDKTDIKILAALQQNGRLTNVELAEVDGYERTQLAQAIWYLRRDFDDGARDLNLLPSLEPIYCTMRL